jgi:plastocyanin
MKKHHIAISILIIIAIVGIMLSSSKKEAIAPTNTTITTSIPVVTQPISTMSTSSPKITATVTYDTTGFSPSKVTIKVGDTVRFINKTSREMDVASNPHPTHTDYPAFDQGKGAFNGKNTFDFTFTQVGIWGYHNHESARDRGEVIVN